MSAREEILASIRIGNRVVHQSPQWSDLPRNYRASALIDRAGVIDLFQERLLDYDATVTRCSPADLSNAIANLLMRLGRRHVVFPKGIDEVLLEGPFELIPDQSLSYAELDQCDCVLTTSTLGIAETATIVQQNAPGQGRRAVSLIPDVHVCIVKATAIVATVPEAFARLASTAHLPTTFVSGPSATADIEMTRVKGVHGPRFLHVVLVEDDAAGIPHQRERTEG